MLFVVGLLLIDWHDNSGPLFSLFFSFLHFHFSVKTYAHRRSARIKNFIERKMTGAPKNSGVHLFPDLVGHFKAQWRQFWIFEVLSLPLGWYLILSTWTKHSRTRFFLVLVGGFLGVQYLSFKCYIGAQTNFLSKKGMLHWKCEQRPPLPIFFWCNKFSCF